MAAFALEFTFLLLKLCLLVDLSVLCDPSRLSCRRPQGSALVMVMLAILIQAAKSGSPKDSRKNSKNNIKCFHLATTRSETKLSFFEMQSIKKNIMRSCAL